MRKLSIISKSVAMFGMFLPAITLAYSDLPAGNAITFDDIGNWFVIIARFLIGISMTIAVIFIVWSGFVMMSSQGNPKQFEAGKTRLIQAVWGVAVILGVGVIINTIAAVVTRDFFCQASILGICLY